jgi:hypothetical protein
VSHPQFIISTYSAQKKLKKSELWDASEPFGIGHPFQWVIEKTTTGLRLRDLQKMSVREFSESELKSSSILSEGGLHFRVHPARFLDKNPGFVPTHILPEEIKVEEDLALFKKCIIGAGGGLAALILIALLMPHTEPKKEEIIPPQFAKLIMTPTPKKAQSAPNGGSSDAGGGKAGNVVQAFKSTQVQHSTQKLLKGGVLSLLSKSNILSGAGSKSALSAMFDHGQKNNTLSPLSGLNSVKSVAVNTLGGSAGGGNGVGYGKGEKAGVQGQGNSFVALETGESQVEEGLSRDEVGKVIHSHIAEVRYCYESAMIRNADVQGKLVIDFVIQGAGKVKTAKINSSTLNDASLDQCIVGRLMKWQFPKPKGGVDVAVTYPFILKSLGK